MDTKEKVGIIIGIITIISALPASINSANDLLHSHTPIPNTGNISVISSPKGASVYLDNVYYGITPTILNTVEQGSHIITFKLAGYEDWSQGIVVEPNNPVSISPKLTPTPTQTSTKGSIYVDSSPQGADIYLDDKSENLVTPSTLTDVEPDSHTIILKKQGFDDCSITVNVEEGITVSISPQLNPHQTEPSEAPNEIPTPSGVPPTPSGVPSAKISTVTVKTYDTGATIHVAFTVYNIKGENFVVCAPCYNLNGEQLTYSNGSYVEIQRDCSAKYDENLYTDLTLHISKEDLQLSPGTADIKLNVAIKYKDQKLDVSDWKYITFN